MIYPPKEGTRGLFRGKDGSPDLRHIRDHEVTILAELVITRSQSAAQPVLMQARIFSPHLHVDDHKSRRDS